MLAGPRPLSMRDLCVEFICTVRSLDLQAASLLQVIT
jgi:hypothetical protein